MAWRVGMVAQQCSITSRLRLMAWLASVSTLRPHGPTPPTDVQHVNGIHTFNTVIAKDHLRSSQIASIPAEYESRVEDYE